ncbi:MAG: peroxiredoxin-like family protein, partial [Bacteroidota bacterium]
PNATGQLVDLANLIENGPVVLTFYRGSWCPYCNLMLNQYQQILPEIKALGAQLVAISAQHPDESLNITEKNNLQFEVLSDAANQVAKQYTTVFQYGETPLATMKELGYDFDSFYGDNSRSLPVPATFIIDRSGKITFAKSMGGDYRNRVEPNDILAALKAI